MCTHFAVAERLQIAMHKHTKPDSPLARLPSNSNERINCILKLAGFTALSTLIGRKSVQIM